MSKKSSNNSIFICSNCSYESLRWAGKCPGCGEWGTLKEAVVEASESGGGPGRTGGRKAAPAKVVTVAEVAEVARSDKTKGSKKAQSTTTRTSFGMNEIDRVLGGGVVPGEVVLLAGEPGVGKSTLLLQVCIHLEKSGPVIYVSGEESLVQLTDRLNRVATSKSSLPKGLHITENSNVDNVISAVEKLKPKVVIVDSIQSLYTDDVGSFPGSLSQVRECGSRLTRMAKGLGIPVIIVGQVTKEGVVAGPKVLEHIVDAVIYFEGDEMGMYRILRGIKNRFGTTDEVGIFEMTSRGLVEVEDPSKVFGETGKPQAGTAVSAVFKGSRTIFVEIQALTSAATFSAPRRLPTGLKKSRLEMLCAVLSRRAGVDLGGDDVFVNVVGGLQIDDPAVDLAVCMAIASSKLDKPIMRSKVFLGEVGLSGGIREVPYQGRILAEAKRRKLSIVSSRGRSAKHVGDVIKRLFTK